MEDEANKNLTAKPVTPSGAQGGKLPAAPVSQSPQKPPFFSKNKKILLILSLVLLAIIGILVIFYLSAVNKTRKLNDARNQVYSSTKKAEFASAKEAAKKGLLIKKDDPYLLKGYIDASSAEGNLTGKEVENFNDANPYIDEAAQKYSYDFRMLLSIGYAYETAGKYNEALNYYNKAISANPTSAEGYFHRGHVLQFLDRTKEADADYDKSYSLDNNYAPVLMVMGSRYFNARKIEESFKAYKKASELPNITDSTKTEALTAASIVRTTQLLYMPEAIALAKKAVDINPNFSPALAQYASSSFINGKAKTGSEYIEKAIKANPRISRNYYLLAQMLRYNKLYIEALKNQKEAISRVENDNTLVGKAQKDGATALYYYDLAKTYDMGEIKVDMVPYLEYALYKNPNLKKTLKNDHLKYNFFKTLSKDEKFLKLIS